MYVEAVVTRGETGKFYLHACASSTFLRRKFCNSARTDAVKHRNSLLGVVPL